MRSRIIFSAFILLFALQSSFSHPWKPSHYVIIDTDGGIDDFKAISMLLASRDVRVLAIISSGGTLDAENTYKKVRSFLDGLHHEGMLVCINKNVSGYNYPLPLSIRYGNEEGIAVPPSSNFVETVKSAVSGESSPVKLISLGSLNSAAILVDAGITFAGVYWSIRGLDPVSGMNYDLDTESAGRIITGQVPLHGVGYTTQNDLYGDDMLKLVSGINTVYAQAVSSLFGSGSPLPDHPFARGGQDDMIPVFLHYPSLFTTGENGSSSFSTPPGAEELRPAITRILGGETVSMNQVVKAFPADSSFYMSDIQPYVKIIIDKYGIEEWSAGVLANELHRHLGVFAIVGVKMGVRALEYFHTGVDEMKIVSYAGSTPPLSCMNDGLQVSTGGTPGHGLLTVINDDPAPFADFIYKERTLRISLKPEIASAITGELRDINYIYGLDSNIYWELVRQKSILYWKNLNRHDIFEITELE